MTKCKSDLCDKKMAIKLNPVTGIMCSAYLEQSNTVTSAFLVLKRLKISKHNKFSRLVFIFFKK